MLLYLFENVSALNITFSKTEVIWLGGSNLQQEDIASFYSYNLGKFHIVYLVIPIKIGRLAKVDWSPIIDKVESCLPN